MNKDFVAISEMIETYFAGLYTGDITKLEAVFHPQSWLFGDINGQPYSKALPEYLDGVKNRQSPRDLGEAQEMETISIEVLNDIAHVKLHVPMLGYNYYDYLLLIRTEGGWMISSKSFTNVQTTADVVQN